MYLHLNQGRWYPWKRIAKYDAFLNMISAQKSDHRSNLELQSEIDFLKQFRIFSFVGIRDQEKVKKIKIVGRDQEPLINLLVQNIFLQPKLIIRVLTNWSQSFYGISGFLGFGGWVPRKPCLDVFLLQIYFSKCSNCVKNERCRLSSSRSSNCKRNKFFLCPVRSALIRPHNKSFKLHSRLKNINSKFHIKSIVWR